MLHLLQQLLDNSAQQYSNKVAAVFGSSSLTYQELDELSNRMAWTLKSVGVSKGDRIGIYLTKSVEGIVAIFGILKLGGVYVPLDPIAPVRRVLSILNDCTVQVLISDQKELVKLEQVLPSSAVRYAVVVDDNQFLPSETLEKLINWQEVLQAPSIALPTPDCSDTDLAYIFYTSGSTGVPKGVMISHQAALNFVNWSAEGFQVCDRDRVSNHAPWHFDLSIFDIFTSLKAGATVIGVPEALAAFPFELANFIATQEITIWYSVPSALTQLVLHGSLQQRQFPKLRSILFAGESFAVKYLRQLMTFIPQAKYYNLYGPTETNVCTCYEVTEMPDETVKSIPIGKACAGNELFAMNDQDEVITVGEVGELYVKGASLMSGYWNLTKQTDAVLMPCASILSSATLEEQDEGLAYRTGDLVRLEPDGNYLFVGRRDRTIKSRGYRVDLGEVEIVLRSHPQVEEVVVIALPDEQIGHRIKAVVKFCNNNSLQKHELVKYCSGYLPRYMIPSAIEICTSLPKTSTGKADIQSLQGMIS